MADFVYIKKIKWEGLDYLTTGLRIEMEQLEQIKQKDFSEIKKIYSTKRVIDFLNQLEYALGK